MKLDTFVGKESIDITEEERNVITERFKKAIKETFPNAKVTFKSVVNDFPSLIVTAKNVVPFGKFRVHSDADNRFIRPKDLVFPTGEISIQLYSKMGYDEAETGPCYAWKEPHPKGWEPEYNKHSYSLSILWHGSHKTYRRHYKSGLEIKNHYLYGTELSDLDFENGLKTIAEITKSWVKEK